MFSEEAVVSFCFVFFNQVIEILATRKYFVHFPSDVLIIQKAFWKRFSQNN